MDSAQVVARFEAERQALARMGHPNVAQVFDGGATDQGRPYFVMEYVAGEPITESSDRRKLSTRERIELFLGVCEGVQHAHQKGLIHRDLKPSNLLVTRHDGRATVKVIDFGVARATTGRLVDRTLHTMVGQVVGTLDYMSPEQANPTGLDVDTRSDIYSLGVVLYELVSGLLPFDFSTRTGRPLTEAQRTLREQDPPTPSTRLRRQSGTATSIAMLRGTDERSLVRQLHGDLDWICMKALERDPARRYASASELADDLRRHLAHEPVLAGRPGVIYRARKFVRRHRMSVGASVVAVAALATAAAGVISGQLEAARKGAELLRLSDGVGLKRLLAQVDGDEHWPAHPDRIPALESWLGRARALHGNLADHRRTLDAMRARAASRGEGEDGPTWRFDSDQEQWQHDELAKLVAGLDALAAGLLEADAIAPGHGWSVPRRIARAEALAGEFAAGGASEAAWARSLPAIRERYPEIDLAPQMGLLPLGPDPESHLFEFAHLLSGVPAERGADGKLVLGDDTGLVLVLLPGGEFLMGSQGEDPGADNYVMGADTNEGPVRPVTLPPFFLSKYEMTQGQWERSVGENPAEGDRAAGHPATSVSWRDCATVTRRLGLALPSEEEWEYASRGGTRTPWWTGDNWESVRDTGRANLRDGGNIDDGQPTLAPVDFEAANPFGLVGLLGNVTEWTSSIQVADAAPAASSVVRYVARGGNWTTGPQPARSAFRRLTNVEGYAVPFLGLRPARPVEPR